ncbi:PREDICTED: uncharacterized protein LOC105315602, partial [Amphimedon queenslandica]|uniref:Ankyrin repeat protein n=1 Tax=Amphimedon queenslandica TaxID=400682 RepID=A0AAN0JZE5_AMPQE
MLLQANANPHLKTSHEEGETTLVLACEKEHKNIMETLVSAGANYNIKETNNVPDISELNPDISKIEAQSVTIDDRKLALYSKWLKKAPKATWADVINALSKTKENSIFAQYIRENLQKCSYADATTRQSSQAELMLETLTAVYEKEILHAIIDLNIEFSSLVMHVQLGLEEKIKNDSDMLQTFTTWLETHMHWNDKLTSISLDEIFRTIDLFYDFIDCSLIVEMSDIFLQDFKFGVKELSIVSELKTYKIRADELQLSAQVEDLHESLPIIYQGHIPDTSNMRMISIKLHNQWESSKMNGLSLLIHNLLPVGHQQSIMKYITICITSEYVNLEYFVHGYTTDSLIDYTRKKLQFMHLIGIFSLYINDHPVFQEDENMNFTFELALVNAVTAGNNEAVELLLQLGCIDDTNKEGETALMLACKRGHEDTVHSLLSAGANVDIEDNKGWTALMIANEHNHISIIHMLLQANANPHLKTSDRSNAVMIASYHGNYEIVELLISKRVDYNCQREDGANAFMLACKSGHTQIVKFLL